MNAEFFFEGTAAWFIVPALIGTGVFLIRSILMLVGGDADMHSEFDADFGDMDLDAADADTGADTGAADSSEQVFQFISIQSLFAFMMGFGWGGFGAVRGAGWGVTAAVMTGLVTGSGTVWLLTKLLTFVYGLHARGNIPISQALELEGTVYIEVPSKGEGSGKVRVVIDEHERYLRAVSNDESIGPRTTVRVVGFEDDNTVVVKPVELLTSAP